MIAVRELTADDIAPLNRYWHEASPEYLRSMGADPDLLPDQEAFSKMMLLQMALPFEEKERYCIIWLLNGIAVGHCNVNQVVFGEEAHMHLHLWPSEKRRQGLGASFVRLSLPYFFNNLQLKTLYCEPYALNPAPHHTLEKVGFEFVEAYITTPGVYSFEQPVKKWALDRDRLAEVMSFSVSSK